MQNNYAEHMHNMQKICKKNMQNTQKIKTRYAKYKTCKKHAEYAKKYVKIKTRYAKYAKNICQKIAKYAKNMPKICSL